MNRCHVGCVKRTHADAPFARDWHGASARVRLTHSKIFAIVLALVASSASAQEPKFTPAAGQEWTNVFASSRANVVYNLQLPNGFRGQLVWTLADAGANRVLPKGRGEVPVAAGDKTAKFALDLPPLNDGVVLKATLTVSLIDAAKKEPVAEHAKTMWIFSADPFVGRLKVLDDLKITLYDPDPKFATADALKSLKIPFDQVDTAAALAESKGNVIIVGEDVSFVNEPELLKTLLPLAKKGATVICLAPAAGTFALPGADSNDGDDLSFKRRTAINEVDSRLDATAWLDCPSPIRATVAIKSVEGSVVGEAVPGSENFPWLQIDYPETKGRLVICGFGVIAHWQRTPTPRYLLDALLKRAIPTEK